MNKRSAFTLIELLIVVAIVAIIAILAAIAVPNFLEAQVRSKVSRSRADVRTIATALEAYTVDYNKYPADHCLQRIVVSGDAITADGYVPDKLSTPVAYITTARLVDPFVQSGLTALETQPPIYRQFYTSLFYQNVSTSIRTAFGPAHSEYLNQQPPALGSPQAIKSAGGWASTTWQNIYGAYKIGSLGPDRNYNGGANIYDPTNGTVSLGDIYRTQTRTEGGGAD